MKYQCDRITPVALVSSICFSPHLPLCLTVHPPALFSQYSSTEPSVWGHLFKAFSSPRILSGVTDTLTKNMSTKNPANMQSLFSKDSQTMQPAVPPCLLFFYLCPTFLHPPLPPCTCTLATRWASHTFALEKKWLTWQPCDNCCGILASSLCFPSLSMGYVIIYFHWESVLARTLISERLNPHTKVVVEINWLWSLQKRVAQ